MTEEQHFFIKTLEIMPAMSQCRFRWYTSEYINGIIAMMNSILSIGDCAISFLLSEENKIILQNASIEGNIEENIYYAEISHDGRMLFKAYDGFEIGNISPLVTLPKEYEKEFVDLMAHVADL